MTSFNDSHTYNFVKQTGLRSHITAPYEKYHLWSLTTLVLLLLVSMTELDLGDRLHHLLTVGVVFSFVDGVESCCTWPKFWNCICSAVHSYPSQKSFDFLH